MTANDPSRQQEAVNDGDVEILDKAIVRIRNQRTVDIAALVQRKRARLYKLEELSKGGLINPSCCEVLTALRSRSKSSKVPSRHTK